MDAAMDERKGRVRYTLDLKKRVTLFSKWSWYHTCAWALVF